MQKKISSLKIGSKNPNKEPSPKHPCTALWKSFSDILEEAGASVSMDYRARRSWIGNAHGRLSKAGYGGSDVTFNNFIFVFS